MAPISMGILIARIVLGLALASHGAQKLFGMFGGHGLAGTAAFFETLGFRPGKLFALAASATEMGAGLLLVLGLGGPLGPALIIMVMIVGAITVHVKNGFFASNGGCELNLMYGATALLLAFSGMGRYSLDHWLGLDRLYFPMLGWIFIGVAVVLAMLNLASRRGLEQ